jgi:cytochrome c
MYIRINFRLRRVTEYALHNMPLGTAFNAPVLTDEQAYDVAGYIVTRDRPKKSNLDQDFPIRLQDRHSIRSLCRRLSHGAALTRPIRPNPGQSERTRG